METLVVKNGELISFINSSFEVFEKHFQESFAKEGDLYRGFDMNLESISEERIVREDMKLYYSGQTKPVKIRVPDLDRITKHHYHLLEIYSHYLRSIQSCSKSFYRKNISPHQIEKIFDNIKRLSEFLWEIKDRYNLIKKTPFPIESYLLNFFEKIHQYCCQNNFHSNNCFASREWDYIFNRERENFLPSETRFDQLPKNLKLILTHRPTDQFKSMTADNFSEFVYDYLPKECFTEAEQESISVFQDLLISRQEIRLLIRDQTRLENDHYLDIEQVKRMISDLGNRIPGENSRQAVITKQQQEIETLKSELQKQSKEITRLFSLNSKLTEIVDNLIFAIDKGEISSS